MNKGVLDSNAMRDSRAAPFSSERVQAVGSGRPVADRGQRPATTPTTSAVPTLSGVAPIEQEERCESK
jgi:hypothetical protein